MSTRTFHVPGNVGPDMVFQQGLFDDSSKESSRTTVKLLNVSRKSARIKARATFADQVVECINEKQLWFARIKARATFADQVVECIKEKCNRDKGLHAHVSTRGSTFQLRT